jgi:multidrug efflux pump
MDSQKEHNESNQIKREFGPSSLAVNNRTSIVILTFIIAIMGIMAYVTIPKENFPEIVIPTIYVGTPYAGNSPVDIENLVTRPIEKEIKSLSGVKNVKSTSIQDYSIVIVEFIPEVEVNKALQDVKDAVDKAKSNLPNDLDKDPNVFEINFSEFPIMNINISGNFSIDELKYYGEYLQDEIEKLPEISKAELKGALEREIRIDADVYKLEAMGVNFSDIENAISAENLTISGGDLLSGEFRRAIRVIGEFTRVDQLKDVIIKNEEQNIVYLRDVAEVTDTYQERNSFSRSKLLPVVSLNVVKRSGENLLNASDKIKEIITKAQSRKFPEGLEVTITNDQSKMTRSQVDNLENSIISGVILVVLVLMFFLGLRNAMFVGIAIPMSMFMAFMLLKFMGVTMSLIVLFSLILALGMLVDNGIVVVENIYRLLEKGYSPIRAAKEGVGEVALPIITSTATTLAAFIPLAFWGGMIGQFMKYLPITLIIVLSSSLFVALIVNPVMTAIFIKEQKGEKVVNKKRGVIIAVTLLILAIVCYFERYFTVGNLLMIFGLLIPLNIFFFSPATVWFQSKVLTRVEDAYYRTMRLILKGWNPVLVFGGTVLLLVFSIGLLIKKAPKVNLFPLNEPKYVNIFIEKPIGTDILSTDAFTQIIEKEVMEMMKPYDYLVESIIAQVGEGTSDPNAGPSPGASPHKARITVSFVDFNLREGQSTAVLMEQIREAMEKYPGVQITVDKDKVGPPVGAPIYLEVKGEDYEKLIELSNMVRTSILNSNIRGIEELKTDLETGKPELIVQIDRDKARRFGLSTYTIAMELRTALFGKTVSKYKEGEDEYNIQLRLKDEYRYDADALMNSKISFRDKFGKFHQIPISSVADVQYSTTYGSIKRKDMDRVIAIFSNVNEGYNANEINKQIASLIKDLELPEGYEVRFGGEQEEQQKTMAFLGQALFIAVACIFLIIVAQFNSITTPFIIMASVVLSTIGVFLGLVIFNMDFIIIMTGVGIISLAGVVVNNAIVLIDYTDLIRARRRKELGIPEDKLLPYNEILDSIIEGGKTRLRPVLLTAITTVLGLIPLALGMNINFFTLLSDFDPQFYIGGDNAIFWGPMAWTVIFGLSFATFLTLVVVPVMYLLSDKAKQKLAGRD